MNILSIEQAKELGMVQLVEQLERDLARRELLNMKPLEEVKEAMEIHNIKTDLEEFDDWD